MCYLRFFLNRRPYWLVSFLMSIKASKAVMALLMMLVIISPLLLAFLGVANEFHRIWMQSPFSTTISLISCLRLDISSSVIFSVVGCMSLIMVIGVMSTEQNAGKQFDQRPLYPCLPVYQYQYDKQQVYGGNHGKAARLAKIRGEQIHSRERQV